MKKCDGGDVGGSVATETLGFQEAMLDLWFFPQKVFTWECFFGAVIPGMPRVILRRRR